jgi:hypothetical protein
MFWNLQKIADSIRLKNTKSQQKFKGTVSPGLWMRKTEKCKDYVYEDSPHHDIRNISLNV